MFFSVCHHCLTLFSSTVTWNILNIEVLNIDYQLLFDWNYRTDTCRVFFFNNLKKNPRQVSLIFNGFSTWVYLRLGDNAKYFIDFVIFVSPWKRRNIGVTFVGGVVVGVPSSLPEHKSVIISRVEFEVGMHASYNDPKCSAQELVLCISYYLSYSPFLIFILNFCPGNFS
jgi:hypothetical protein